MLLNSKHRPFPASSQTILSDSLSRPPLSPPERWSSRLAEKYQLELSDCFIDWLDSERFKHQGFGEFSAPIHPADLLTDAPEAIWPALMACDMLPVIGNQSGDYLCARVGPDNTITEFVHWYHGGGDWIPWGNRLQEAILFDALRHQLPGPHHRHAEPAEPRSRSYSEQQKTDPLVRWALKRLPAEIKAVTQGAHPADFIASTLLKRNIASAAVQFELVEDSLFPSEGEPNYPNAESIALRTIGGRSDQLEPMSWTWNVAALAANKRGDLDLAIDRFGRALLCSNFSDQSVRLQHGWLQTDNGKYAARQLQHLVSDNAFPHFDEHQLSLLDLYSSSNIEQRGQAVTDYWIDRSMAKEKKGNFAAAYDCMVRAGWDLGAAPMQAYCDILKQVARLAALAGQHARAAVAQTHLACFHDRYGQL